MTFSVTPQVSPVFFVARVKGRSSMRCGRPGRRSNSAERWRWCRSARTTARTLTVHSAARSERGSRKFGPRRAAPSVYGRQFGRRSGAAIRDDQRPVLVQSAPGPGACRAMAKRQSAVAGQNSRSVVSDRGEEGIRNLALVGRPGPRPLLPARQHRALAGADRIGFQNNLAYTLGQVCVWQATYYVGTSGEYDMNAVRSWE